MSWEALIGDDWQRAGIKILFRHTAPGQPTLYDNCQEQIQVTDPGREVTLEPLVLTEDRARALLTALIRYYDGGEDTRSLRKDYDAERIRVDRLLNVVSDIATR
jgi:hypothetical protein